MATQKKILVNPKHVQPYSLPFFGKLIITSNDEHKFSKVDDKEIRYWVRKVPSLKDKANHNILNDMVAEIPNFLQHLLTLPQIDFSKSRMVFEAEEIETDALAVVKNESKSQLYKELFDIFEDLFANSPDLKSLEFIPNDVKDRFYRNNSHVGTSYIRGVMKKEFDLKALGVRKYYPFEDSKMNTIPVRTGSAFKLERSYFKDVDISEEQHKETSERADMKGTDVKLDELPF